MSELNNEQIVAQRKSVQLVNADGVTMIELANEGAETKELVSKGVATGVREQKWVVRNTVAQVKNGDAMVVSGDEGEQRVLTELRVVVKTYSAEAVQAKREAEALKTFVQRLRKNMGLSKSKQVVAERDRLTVADVSDWMLGKREVMRKSWDSLTDKLKADCIKVQAEASKVKEPKAATPTQIMVAMAAVLEAEGKLDADTKAQVETLLARQAKAREAATKAK